MAYSAYAVANAFICRAVQGKLGDLTPMKLQKLMYFAQVWHLKATDTPLLDDHFSRWQYGPVIPSIYHAFKFYGAKPVTGMYDMIVDSVGTKLIYSTPEIPESDQETWALLDAVIQRWGQYKGAQLSGITHSEGSAWAANGRKADGSVITWEEMKKDCHV